MKNICTLYFLVQLATCIFLYLLYLTYSEYICILVLSAIKSPQPLSGHTFTPRYAQNAKM